MLRIEIHNSFMFAYGSWHPEGHLYCLNKFLDGEIQKWHISSKFVYPELCNLTYRYEYPKDKNLKLLRIKWTFHINVLGVDHKWYGAGRIRQTINWWRPKTCSGRLNLDWGKAISFCSSMFSSCIFTEDVKWQLCAFLHLFHWSLFFFLSDSKILNSKNKNSKNKIIFQILEFKMYLLSLKILFNF